MAGSSLLLAPLGLLLITLPGSISSSLFSESSLDLPRRTPPLVCEFNGKQYQYGARWKHRCNTCFCSLGVAICTEMACASGCYHEGIYYKEKELFKIAEDTTCTCLGPFGEPPYHRIGCRTMKPRPNTQCYYNGTYYEQKEDVKIDQCNHCVCMVRNLMVCSIRTCYDNIEICMHNREVYSHLQSYYDDCNLCTCYRQWFFCTQLKCLPA